jgi:hypothetical protein
VNQIDNEPIIENGQLIVAGRQIPFQYPIAEIMNFPKAIGHTIRSSATLKV